MVLPSQPNAVPTFGAIEIGLLLGAAGVLLWSVDYVLNNDIVDRHPTAKTSHGHQSPGGSSTPLTRVTVTRAVPDDYWLLCDPAATQHLPFAGVVAVEICQHRNS
jgi:hypothetical protein